MSEVDIIPHSNSCRCCLSNTPDAIDIFSENIDINIPEALQNICGIDISPESNLPRVVCTSCMHVLRTCHNFRVTTRQTDQTLHNFLAGHIVVMKEPDDSYLFVDGSGEGDEASVEMKVKSIEDSSFNLTCPYCCKTFIHRRNLQIHKQRHFMLGKYGCPSCTQRFHTTFDLLRHRSTVHIKEKPYQCNDCPKRFPTKPELNRHQRLLHNPVKNFSCSQCGMQFKLKANAKQHIHLVHNQEKSHICDVCGRAFALVSKLKAHQKSSKCERPVGMSVVEEEIVEESW